MGQHYLFGLTSLHFLKIKTFIESKNKNIKIKQFFQVYLKKQKQKTKVVDMYINDEILTGALEI